MQGVKRRTVLVVIFFDFFEIITIVCFGVAIFDQVHVVEAIHFL